MSWWRRVGVLAGGVLWSLLLAGCGDEECVDADECDDEIFHIDGAEVYDTLRRWLVIAIAVLAAVVVLRWVIQWVRHRWLPRDADW